MCHVGRSHARKSSKYTPALAEGFAPTSLLSVEYQWPKGRSSTLGHVLLAGLHCPLTLTERRSGQVPSADFQQLLEPCKVGGSSVTSIGNNGLQLTVRDVTADWVLVHERANECSLSTSDT